MINTNYFCLLHMIKMLKNHDFEVFEDFNFFSNVITSTSGRKICFLSETQIFCPECIIKCVDRSRNLVLAKMSLKCACNPNSFCNAMCIILEFFKYFMRMWFIIIFNFTLHGRRFSSHKSC